MQNLNVTVTEYYGCSPKLLSKGQDLLLLQLGLEAYGPKSKLDTETEIGIEIELEKINQHPNLHYWKYVEDGSLKEEGVELVSFPMSGSVAAFAIEEYMAFLNVNKKATFSHRCSIHVHINVSKLKLAELRLLIATYLCTEQLLFSLVAPYRNNYSYCYSLADTLVTWKDLHPNSLDEQFKYASLNPHHLVDFGTLEFRHHQGTKSSKELIAWIHTICRLFKTIKENDLVELEEKIKKLNTISNYYEFCKLVFKEYLPLEVDLYNKMRDNVSAAKLFLE